MTEPVKPADPCIILRDVRISYPHVYQATQFQGTGEFSYSAKFHIVNGSDNDKMLRAEIAAKATAQWGEKASLLLPTIEGRTQTFCYVDGRLTDNEGAWILTAKRPAKSGKPRIVDRDGKRDILPEEGKLYGGCYVHLKCSIYAQDNAAGKGMRATLVGIQFSKDGESFGGAPPASAEGFSELEPVETFSDLQ